MRVGDGRCQAVGGQCRRGCPSQGCMDFFMAEGSGGILCVDCLLVAARMVWNVSWMGGGGGYSAYGSTILN